LAVQVPACSFYQVDLVRGAVIEHLSDQHTYHGENRFVTSKNGGTQSCTVTTTPPATPPVVQSSTNTKSLPNTGAGSIALIGLGSSAVAGLLHANRRRIFGR
jgi:LPXTG-motif cell wall-anchored protein